jgi:hypothetical protein
MSWQAYLLLIGMEERMPALLQVCEAVRIWRCRPSEADMTHSSHCELVSVVSEGHWEVHVPATHLVVVLLRTSLEVARVCPDVSDHELRKAAEVGLTLALG